MPSPIEPGAVLWYNLCEYAKLWQQLAPPFDLTAEPLPRGGILSMRQRRRFAAMLAALAHAAEDDENETEHFEEETADE